MHVVASVRCVVGAQRFDLLVAMSFSLSRHAGCLVVSACVIVGAVLVGCSVLTRRLRGAAASSIAASSKALGIGDRG